MSDLIRREDVMALWDKYHYEIATKAVEFDKDLRAIPSTEPKHGHWDIEISADGYQATYRCSECGHQFKWLYDPHFPPVFNYCQKCGANMREKS